MPFRSAFQRAFSSHSYELLPTDGLSRTDHDSLNDSGDGYCAPKRLASSRKRLAIVTAVPCLVVLLVLINAASLRFSIKSRLVTKAEYFAQVQSIFDQNPPSKWLEQPHPSGPFTKEKAHGLIQFTSSDATSTHAAHAKVVEQLPGYFKGIYAPGSKGIVILAGGDYTEFAMTGVGMLRRVGSRLPIEVWMRDIEEEIPGACDEFVQYGNVTCRHLSEYMNITGSQRLQNPYQWKAFTILFSEFEQVLFLDADNLAITNPDIVFETTRYQEQDVIVWPDYWPHSGSLWLPYIVGLADGESEFFRQGWTAEAGQLVWNKRKKWKSLLLAMYYNYYGPDFYYTIISLGWDGWGDKDTFYIALQTLGHNVTLQHGIVTGFPLNSQTGVIMIQGDPSYPDYHRPLFAHANIRKTGVQRLLCDPVTCDIPADRIDQWRQREEASGIAAAIQAGQRLWEASPFTKFGMDPEPVVWQTLRQIACQGKVYGSPRLCDKVHDYIKKAFPDLDGA